MNNLPKATKSTSLFSIIFGASYTIVLNDPQNILENLSYLKQIVVTS